MIKTEKYTDLKFRGDLCQPFCLKKNVWYLIATRFPAIAEMIETISLIKTVWVYYLINLKV